MGVTTAESDGYHHPADEAEIAELVGLARRDGRKLRVIGSGHSEPDAIIPGLVVPGQGADRRAKPPEGAVGVMMDRMRALTLHPSPDGLGVLAEIEAGRNVGRNPYDPRKVSSWESSINLPLARAGFALSDLGGISHQTIGGFLSTGSAGGSVKYAIGDDVERLRFVDGLGRAHEVGRGDPLFEAAGVSLGLLGVITKVWLRAGPTYNIAGQEAKRPAAACGIDLFGDPGADGIPFEDYLRRTPYARQMWWPQHDFERIVLWQAARMEPTPAFTPKPYEELGRAPRQQSLAGCLLYTLLGNLDDLSVVPGKLGPWRAQLEAEVEGDPDPNECHRRPFRRVTRADVMGTVRDLLRGAAERRTAVLTRESVHVEGLVATARALSGVVGARAAALGTSVASHAFAEAVTAILGALLDGALEAPLARGVGAALKQLLPDFIDEILGLFVPLDGPAGPQIFQDCWFCGLPMDNQMDDELWPTTFTELFLPLEQARPVMRALRDHYRAGGDKRLALARTGTFSCEVYAAKRSPFWLSPAWQRDSVRIDLFWFGHNAGDPAEDFYPQFWELLRPFGFRPHLGKVLPRPARVWAPYLREQFPMLERFLALRAELDPHGVFATSYWQEHLGFEVGGGR